MNCALPPLVAMYAKAVDTQQQPIEQAIVRIATPVSDADARSAAVLTALNSATGSAKLSLLRLAGQIGGDKAIAALHQARTNTDAAVQDAAIRGLADSPDLKAAPDLLDIAKTTKDETHKALALRGYIRLADQFTAQPAEQLNMYKQSLAIAAAAEKRSAISGVGGLSSLEALAVATSCLADADVREQAGMAVVGICGPPATAPTPTWSKPASRRCSTRRLQPASRPKSIASCEP